MALARLVKLYFRIDLPQEGEEYRHALTELVLAWQKKLAVQAYEVKEDSPKDVSYYAEPDSDEYRQAFLAYHTGHGWNVDEMRLLGLTVDQEYLHNTAHISWTISGSQEESEVRIFWQRPGRGDEIKTLDCWLLKYDGSPTNRDGEPSAIEEKDLSGELRFRKGLLFCSTFNPAIRDKLVRLSFKWERFLRERDVQFQRWDNFGEFD